MLVLKLLSQLNTKIKILILVLLLGLTVFASYLYESKKSRTAPIFFTTQYKPFIVASFEGTKHPFIIDTGAAYHAILDETIANNLKEKKFFSTIKLTDFDQNTHQLDEFYAEKIKFCDINFGKFFFLIPSTPFFGHNHYSKEPKHVLSFNTSTDNPFSYLGHLLLGKMGLYIDFKHSILKFYKTGLVPLYNWPFGFLNFESKLPLQYSHALGPVCLVDTDMGKMRFLLDTGCPISIIHPDKLNHLSPEQSSVCLKKFKINHKNFGPVTITLEPKTPLDQIDGILGLDFFENKELFLNIPEHYFCLRKKH